MDVKGYEERYTINENGDVFSKRNNKIMKQTISGKRYVVNLTGDGSKQKTYYVYDLIHQHFPHINIYNRPIVDGINAKYIIGFPEYIIINTGQVYSLKGERYLTPCHDKKGYYRVGVFKDHVNKIYCFKIHRGLALHFIPNPNNLPIVDHINRDKSDNRLENLRWATIQENCWNVGISKVNKSGVIGVRYDPKCSIRPWVASLNNIKKHFKTKEEAITGRRGMEECHPDYFRN